MKKEHTEGGAGLVNVVALKETGARRRRSPDCLLDRSTNRQGETATPWRLPTFAPVPLTATLEQQGRRLAGPQLTDAKASAAPEPNGHTRP
jgi:hypothetical protein